jgi:predicted Fe-Mo cluster-binding NifX family protein
MVVTTENGSCRAVLNRNHNYLHSFCQPLLSLAGKHMDGMIVGGIGMGALEKIQAAHINVYLSEFACLSVKYLLSFWLRVKTGAEGSKGKRSLDRAVY